MNFKNFLLSCSPFWWSGKFSSLLSVIQITVSWWESFCKDSCFSENWLETLFWKFVSRSYNNTGVTTKWKYFGHKTICHLWDLKQCFLWNITLHAALTGRAKNEHQIWFMHTYKGSNLPLLGCYYFLVYVTRSERLGKGCPTLHTVHNRYRRVFSKKAHKT